MPHLPLTNDGNGLHWGGAKSGRASAMATHRKWDIANVVLSSVLLLLGVALAGLCSWDFFGPLKLQGQIVGVGNAGLGLLGLVCCAGLPSLVHPSGPSSRSCGLLGLTSGPGRASVRTALLVGLAWAAMSTTSLLSQMSTDVGVHCSLAESFVRVSHLEGKLTALKHDDMMTQVFFRLNELDDMLDLVHEGAVGAGEARAVMHHAKSQDREYVNHRVQRLQKHAESVATALRSRALEVKHNISHWRTHGDAESAAGGLGGGWGQGSASAGGHVHLGGVSDVAHDIHGSGHEVHGPAVHKSGIPLEPTDRTATKQAEEALWLLEKRIEAVDSVIHYLDTKHATGEMTFEEYEVILGALVDGGTAGVGGWAAGADVINVEALKRDQSELPRLKESYGRLAAEQYGHEAGAHLEAVQKIQKKREDARQDFEARFMQVMDQHVPVHPTVFHESLIQAMEDLPAHCISEMRGYHIGWWIIMVTLAVQMASAHAALTAIIHVTAAKDD